MDSSHLARPPSKGPASSCRPPVTLPWVARRPPAPSTTDAPARQLRCPGLRGGGWPLPIARRAARHASGYARGSVSNRWVRISLCTQHLEVCERAGVIACYPVSTSAKGAGERVGSEQTPRGAHEVRELIGEGAARGAVFVGRCLTGETYTRELRAEDPDRDWILSRVIWLSGLEAGRNLGGEVDTYDRYIYIHGTPEDEPMGEPRSHGCVRMRNEDVIDLFALLELGTLVQIEE